MLICVWRYRKHNKHGCRQYRFKDYTHAEHSWLRLSSMMDMKAYRSMNPGAGMQPLIGGGTFWWESEN